MPSAAAAPNATRSRPKVWKAAMLSGHSCSAGSGRCQKSEAEQLRLTRAGNTSEGVLQAWRRPPCRTNSNDAALWIHGQCLTMCYIVARLATVFIAHLCVGRPAIQYDTPHRLPNHAAA
jgi:hypothetical protein